MHPAGTRTASDSAAPDEQQTRAADSVELDRSARKRAAILGAARELFLRQGYLGTSMDEVAAAAKVSKQTVYKNFGDKRRLFVELLTGDMDRADATVAALAQAIPDTQNLPADLRAFARAYLSAVTQPHLIRLRRVVIGEAERFPELAAAWYAHGPAQAYAMFTRWFRTLDERGLLRIDDPVLAAQNFNWLILSVPLNQAMAHPIEDVRATETELHRYADEGVRVFLAAYGATTSKVAATTSQRSPRTTP